MRSRLIWMAIAAAAPLAGCPKQDDKAPAPGVTPSSTTGTTEPAVSKAPANDSNGEAQPSVSALTYVSKSGEDRVGASPQMKSDGLADHHLRATVQGDIRALILTVCTGGKHTISQWDTLAKGDRAPSSFWWKDGDSWVLGVADDENASLNDPDGRLSKTSFAPDTTLNLYAADNGLIQAGGKLCLSALGPDGSAVATSETSLP